MSIATKLKSGETEYDIRDADAQERLITAEKKIKTLEETVAGGEGKTIFTAEYESKLEGIEAGAQVNTVTGVKGSSESTYRKGNINITKTNIGLGNVDNTSDEDKPISTAVQEALNGKLDSDDISSDAYDFLACISEPASLTFEIDGAAFNPYEWNTLAVTTVTVASATSRHASVTDYQCNGTNDTEMFQAAINSLPSSGGKITILEGTYTITSPLSVSKSVVFEGMGAGTVINCTNHSFLNNTTTGCRITIRDMAFNLTGEMTAAAPFISARSDLDLIGCSVTADTMVTEQETNYIKTYTNANIAFTTFDVTTRSTFDGACCAIFGFTDGYNNTVSNCDITLTNDSIIDYCLNLYASRGYDTISNCRATLKGSGSGLFTYLTERSRDITGCYIDVTDTYSDVCNYNAGGTSACFAGNKVHYASGAYLTFNRVSDNYFKGSGTLYFYGSVPIVTSNRFVNSASNSIVGDDYIIFKDNTLRYNCTVTSSSTAKVSDNVIYSSLT